MDSTYKYTISVLENFGNWSEPDSEESSWGPYYSTMTLSRPLEDIEPFDVIGNALDVDGIEWGEDYLMFDAWDPSVDTDTYCRYNYLIRYSSY